MGTILFFLVGLQVAFAQPASGATDAFERGGEPSLARGLLNPRSEARGLAAAKKTDSSAKKDDGKKGATQITDPAVLGQLAAIKTGTWQRKYTYQMTEAFLLVAYSVVGNAKDTTCTDDPELDLCDDDNKASGAKVDFSNADVAENTKNMNGYIDKYKKGLDNMQYGADSKAMKIDENTNVKNTLVAARKEFDKFSALLKGFIQSGGPYSKAELLQVHKGLKALDDASKVVYDALNGLARVNGVEEDIQKIYARRAARLLATVQCEAVFVALEVEKTYYLSQMTSLETALKDIRESLLYGNLGAGVPEIAAVCILLQMTRFDAALDKYIAHEVLAQKLEKIDKDLLTKMVVDGRLAEAQMLTLLDLFDTDDGSCNAAGQIKPEAWFKLITSVSNEMMLTQKATRIYLKLASGLQVKDSDKLALTQSLEEAQASLRKCMKGSYNDGIPSPPTQEIKDALSYAWYRWKYFNEDIRASLDDGVFPISVVEAVSARSDKVYGELRKVQQMYLEEVLIQKPELPSTVWAISGRQAALIQKSSCMALRVGLSNNPQPLVDTWKYVTDEFTQNHRELLYGTDASKHAALPRTTDACILTAMDEVLVTEKKLVKVQTQIVNMRLSNSGADRLPVIIELDYLSKPAIEAMSKAVQKYKDGYGSCTTVLKEDQWEVGLQMSGKIPYLLQKSMTEYNLLASGLAATWMNRSATALVNHQIYIRAESRAPILVEALTDLNRAWKSFKATDEERALGLRVSYITLNPYPHGQKDKMMVAEGQEEYHAVHLKYHGHYRNVLYDRNYYDICILDLEGNLIYTVKKGLDYGTNFARNGQGVWRISGLGDAYEAAIENPDKINVIDWAPYGPKNGAMASFLSTGVRAPNGQMIGVFATEMPPDSKPIDSSALLSESLGKVEKMIEGFKFGDETQQLRPPPKQIIADKLFKLYDTLNFIKPTLKAKPHEVGASFLFKNSSDVMKAADEYLKSYVDAAKTDAPKLLGIKVQVIAAQKKRVQSMTNYATLIGMGTEGATRASLAAEMASFEQDHVMLVTAFSNRRLQTNTAATTTDDKSSKIDLSLIGQINMISMLDDVYSKWMPLKTTLSTITAGGEAKDLVLWSAVTETAQLVGKVEDVFAIMATTTRTTTLMQLEILAPMPMTGDWAAGATMKVASLVAEGIINQQQKILPGYNLKSVFFDDKCDSVQSSQIVLGEMAIKDTYIAMGGAGCSDVCASTSFLATTQRLPFLSYECPAASLSDTETYPKLTRFGTVTTAAVDVIAELGQNWSWPAITVISGDPAKYRTEAEAMRDKFVARGFTSTYEFAFDTQWEEILALMQRLKDGSKGQSRVYFLVGTEDYFRKVICATILAKAEKGITWLTQGSWPDDWWKKSDKLAGQQRKWLAEDAAGEQLRLATLELKRDWDAYQSNGTAEERRVALNRLYHTPLLEKLDRADGPEAYHATHAKWHPVYRQILYDRGYYDIFIHDLQGDLIYSVYKESDFATNFLESGNGKWKDSGLGDAFRAAVRAPTNVSYIDWKPYGPSAGALAAFLSTGILGEDGKLIGAYTIQLPPGYKRSIEQVEPECSLAAIADSFEGAINIVGLGRPTEEKMVAPLPCFDGHSPQSFNSLLDQHIIGGYPLGDRSTQVENPYGMIKANAADAVCAIAFTVKYLMEQGHTIQEIQKPNGALYDKFVDYVKTKMDFMGASGPVKFSGNDRPHHLVVQQVQSGSNVDIGLVAPQMIESTTATDKKQVNITWTNGGPNGLVWQKEKSEPAAADNFPYWTLKVFVPVILLCTPTIAGVINGWRSGSREMAKNGAPTVAMSSKKEATKGASA